MIPSRSARFVVRVVAALAALGWMTPVGAQHEHEHASTTAAVTRLQLDIENKWPTDASLREAMAAIRAAFDADHPAIHAGTESDAQYAALATAIEAQTDAIVANCVLPPAADANLHYVIADLLQGVSLMRGEDLQRTRHEGAALVHGALIAYPKYFNDPTWSGASR